MKYAKNALGRVLATQAGYDIVTALRGPDFEHNVETASLKSSTTAVIRYHCGIPKSNTFYASVSKDNQDKADYRKTLGTINGEGKDTYIYVNSCRLTHFVQHAFKAFEALGLKWNEVNE